MWFLGLRKCGRGGEEVGMWMGWDGNGSGGEGREGEERREGEGGREL